MENFGIFFLDLRFVHYILMLNFPSRTFNIAETSLWTTRRGVIYDNLRKMRDRKGSFALSEHKK